MFLINRKVFQNTVCPVCKSVVLTSAFLFLATVFAPVATGQQLAPSGSYIQWGPSLGGGFGAELGVVDARTVYIRELHVLSDFEPVFRSTDDQVRLALLVGFSLRVLGFERLIGGVSYRGFDVDLGLRVGPGLSFSSRDTRIERNKRFVLVAEPTLRVSRAFGVRRVFFVEAGTTNPFVRFGLWHPL